MTIDEPLLDNEQVENLRQLFNDTLGDFFQTYFNDFEEKQTQLLTAIKENSLDVVVKIAHSLKGSSLNVGALALAKACFELEEAGRNKNIEKIKFQCDYIQNIFPKTKAAFLEHIH